MVVTKQINTLVPGGASSVPVAYEAEFLAEKAIKIHAILKKRVYKGIIEVGQHLVEVRDSEVVTHGTWITWIKVEFGWSDQTARNYIYMYELSRDPKSQIIWDLKLPLQTIYQLAAPKGEAAREEIFARNIRGETISAVMVKEALAKAKDGTDENLEKETSEPEKTDGGVIPEPTSSPASINVPSTGNGGDPGKQADERRQYYADGCLCSLCEAGLLSATGWAATVEGPEDEQLDDIEVFAVEDPSPEYLAAEIEAVAQIAHFEHREFLETLIQKDRTAFVTAVANVAPAIAAVLAFSKKGDMWSSLDEDQRNQFTKTMVKLCGASNELSELAASVETVPPHASPSPTSEPAKESTSDSNSTSDSTSDSDDTAAQVAAEQAATDAELAATHEKRLGNLGSISGELFRLSKVKAFKGLGRVDASFERYLLAQKPANEGEPKLTAKEQIDQFDQALAQERAKINGRRKPAKSGKVNGHHKPADKELNLEALLKINPKRFETTADLDAHIERVRLAHINYSGPNRQDFFDAAEKRIDKMQCMLDALTKIEKAKGLKPVNTRRDEDEKWRNEQGAAT